MPTSPKVFHSRTTSRFRPLSGFSLVFLIFGIAGVLIGVISVTSLSRECPDAKPRSVSVVWDRSGAGGGGLNDVGASKRHKVMAFVGIQTGFGSVVRRKAIRQTWLFSDRQGLLRLEEATALAFRFVIGQTNDKTKMAALQKEVNVYGDFMLIEIEEEYNSLPQKTLAFFKTAFALYDSDFYVKADDDIYLRPDRLSLLLAKERMHTRTYLGCMKNGPVVTDPNMKWYEPLSHLFGEIYFLHAYGPIYALSADVVSSLVALRNDSFRMFSNEDVTIGSWMLAMNVNHENNHALCASECSSSSIAVWDIPRCSGLCNPEMKMLELHKKAICSGASASSDE